MPELIFRVPSETGNRMGWENEAVVRVYKTDHTALSGELNLEKFLHTTPFKLF